LHNHHAFISKNLLPLQFNLFWYLVIFEHICCVSGNNCLINVERCREVKNRPRNTAKHS
jgi:hypothetical protein